MSRGFAAALVALSIALAGCGRGPAHVDQSAYTWTGAIPAGHWLYLRNVSGRITVERSSSPDVQVSASKTWRRNRGDVRFAEAAAGGDVIICTIYGSGLCSPREYQSRPPRHWWNIFTRSPVSDGEVDYVIGIPAGVRVDLHDVNGGIRVADAGAQVVAETVNGAVTISTSRGPVEAKSINGAIRARIDSLSGPGDIDLSTINGSVTAELPIKLDGMIDLSTVNGHLDVDYPLTLSGMVPDRHLQVQLGAGGRAIRLSTINGSVRLRKIQS